MGLTISKQTHGETAILFIKGTEYEIKGEIFLLFNSAVISEVPRIEVPCTSVLIRVERLIDKLSRWTAGRLIAEIDLPKGQHFRAFRASVFDKLVAQVRPEKEQWYESLEIEPRLQAEAIRLISYSVGLFEPDLAIENSLGYRLTKESGWGTLK